MYHPLSGHVKTLDVVHRGLMVLQQQAEHVSALTRSYENNGCWPQGVDDAGASCTAVYRAALAGAGKSAEPHVTLCQVRRCSVRAGAPQPQGKQVHQCPHGVAAQKQGAGPEGGAYWVCMLSPFALLPLLERRPPPPPLLLFTS